MQLPSLENVSINTLERVFEEFYRSPFVCGYNQIIISSLLSNRILASVYRSIERKHEYSLWDLFKTFLRYWPHEQKWACGMWYSPWKTRPQRMRKGIAIFVWKQHNQKDRGVRGSLLRPNLEKGWLPISFPTREVFGDNLIVERSFRWCHKETDQRYWRAAWFSTPSRVKRPCDDVCAAVMRAVALGRQEFGHMYLRIKSSALEQKWWFRQMI